MKRFRLETAVFIIITAVLALNALFLFSGQRFTWSALAQSAYYYSQPPARPPVQRGIVPLGINAIIDENEDGSINIISLGPDGSTVTGLTLTVEELAALPDNPDEAIVVARTSDGYITVYRLPTGEFQANIGPDREGKIFVYIFEFNPLKCIKRYEFSTSDPTPRFVGAC